MVKKNKSDESTPRFRRTQHKDFSKMDTSQTKSNLNKKVKQRKPKKRHPIMKWSFISLFSLVLIATLLGQIYIFHIISDVPKVSYTALHSDNSSNMYASDGTLIWSSGKNRRIYVKMKDVPAKYKNMLLATEDIDYYKHEGFSVKGIANAVYSVVKAKLGYGDPDAVRGGSTIEQQLIKLTVFSTSSKDRTLTRKLRELYLASQLIHNYSRSQILEFYINKINLGENSYGAQTIAHTYYGKTLDQLDTNQLAIIAGLGQAPSLYNLYDRPKEVEQRRNTVLAQALKYHKINRDDYNRAKNTPVTEGLKPRYWDTSQVEQMTKTHNAFVSSALAQVKSMGYDINKTPLQIHTTLNIDADNHLRDVFDNHPEYFQDNRQQAAGTITDPQSGYVIAQSGGRFSNTIGGYNRATAEGLSTGSSIKPILDYGPALEYFNWSTNHSVDSSPYTYKGTNVTATDYGGTSHGIVTMQDAIRHSYNGAAIRTLNQVGDTRARQFIGKLGITTSQTLQDSTALGLDVPTDKMASAIGAFGQNGVYHPTQYVTKLVFPDDSIKQIKFNSTQAMRPSVAFEMTSILKGVLSDQGTLAKGQMNGINAAAKTGTVGYPAGANVPSGVAISMSIWTVSYTKSYAIAIWEGYDNPMQPNSYINENQLATGRANMYKDIMTYLAKGRDVSDWSKPDTVSKISGDGLSAQYSLLDNPTTSADDANLKDGTVNSNGDYKNLKKRSKISKVYKPNNHDSVPSGYDSDWQSKLQSEENNFYAQHQGN